MHRIEESPSPALSSRQFPEHSLAPRGSFVRPMARNPDFLSELLLCSLPPYRFEPGVALRARPGGRRERERNRVSHTLSGLWGLLFLFLWPKNPQLHSFMTLRFYAYDLPSGQRQERKEEKWKTYHSLPSSSGLVSLPVHHLVCFSHFSNSLSLYFDLFPSG